MTSLVKILSRMRDRKVAIHERLGIEGFEPSTFCSQSRHATKLRYIPNAHPELVQVNCVLGSLVFSTNLRLALQIQVSTIIIIYPKD